MHKYLNIKFIHQLNYVTFQCNIVYHCNAMEKRKIHLCIQSYCFFFRLHEIFIDLNVSNDNMKIIELNKI